VGSFRAVTSKQILRTRVSNKPIDNEMKTLALYYIDVDDNYEYMRSLSAIVLAQLLHCNVDPSLPCLHTSRIFGHLKFVFII